MNSRTHYRNPSQVLRQNGNTTALFVLIAIAAIAIGIFVQTGVNKPAAMPEFAKTIILPKSKPLKDAAFIDHQGQAFGLQQLRGKWSILFFGFTNCPDICPTTMQTLKQVKQRVTSAGLWDNYQVIMVSVDPERDTTELLANYVPYFDPEFIGISSSEEITTEFAKQLGILFVKRQSQGNALYEVDHSASLILINPQGEWAGAITAPHKADEISEDLIKLAEYSGNTVVAAKKPENKVVVASKPAVNEQQDLVIKQAWIRPAPPKAMSMAGYFELSNTTEEDIVIVSSQSSRFEMTMIHNTVVDNGVARMEHMERLVIPAQGSVKLMPLGTHMMLMRPASELAVGELVDINLISDKGVNYQYSIAVRPQPQR